ncbi:MAG TPA: class I fructose-bisphosphate aldolase [Candidatus Dormibacteraeota bacterium]|jgi:fructose-bisphosphate aldolase class I|nr:class I fructose-bisphosphate aldolase [Candidatus Dormibacteraeota bacterium]
MGVHDLEAVARAMVAPHKGILAADESTPTIGKRFAALGIENTEANRQAYRDMLFGTPDLGEHISGVILYDETIRQEAVNGTPFPELLMKYGIIPGIKVDTGAKDLALHPGEKVTEGLDGLRERIAEYVRLGARFAKWRAVITIGEGIPSRACLVANGHALARYAALCQEGGLVPIVEPEVLMDGDHSIERSEKVTEETLHTVFDELYTQDVALEGIVLKPSMVIAGKGAPRQASVEEVAERTLAVLRRCVPPAVPGIAFLSGGQSAELATRHLQAMNASGDLPWGLSFSYGRALQDPALKAWSGDPSKVAAAREQLSRRARNNGAARDAGYTPEMEAA